MGHMDTHGGEKKFPATHFCAVLKATQEATPWRRDIITAVGSGMPVLLAPLGLFVHPLSCLGQAAACAAPREHSHGHKCAMLPCRSEGDKENHTALCPFVAFQERINCSRKKFNSFESSGRSTFMCVEKKERPNTTIRFRISLPSRQIYFGISCLEISRYSREASKLQSLRPSFQITGDRDGSTLSRSSI